MRDILFRGLTKDGRWVYGYPFVLGKGSEYEETYILGDIDHRDSIYDVWENAEKVIPETVGQYTGLVDRNGKKIFEYDVCRFREWKDGEMCWVGAVCYEHQQFVISGPDNKECATDFTLRMSRFIPRDIEVVGNIHDNPDWVKGEL